MRRRSCSRSVSLDQTPVDWDEVDRLADLPSFGVAQQMADLKAEVERELD